MLSNSLEKITKQPQVYSVTFRGAKNLGTYNRLNHMLSDNGIRHKHTEYLSKTRDDCGLLKYYIRITFITDRAFEYGTNRKKITWEKLCQLLKENGG